MDNIRITKMYWHNIYLTMHLEGEHIDEYDFSITDLKNSYPVEVDKNILTINIVNIKDTKLLKNGKWYIQYRKNDQMRVLSLTNECAYQLENLDKIYRYGAQCYAYVINFLIHDSETIQKKVMLFPNIIPNIINCNEQDDLILCIFTTYMKRNDHPEKKDVFLESKSISQFIRKIVFIVTKASIRLLYSILNIIRRKDGKHILLMSETRVPIGGNLKALDDRLKERDLDKKFKISYSFSKTLQQSKWVTFFTWSRLLWLISKQDYIFVDDYVPIFKTIHLDKKTKLIQLWHAGVGFKSVGYSRFGKAGSPHPFDSCHREYDLAIVGSKGLIPVYEEVFGIDKEKFMATGLPRLDHYLDESRSIAYKKQFFKDYPELKNRKIIMFAPTYRGNTQKEAFYPYEKIDLCKVFQMCNKGYAFIFKMHPFIKEKVEIPEEYQTYIKDLSNYGDINDMFYVTDILISDFSSNIYEFALQHKPMIFYAFDKDYYQLTRGVHRTLDEAPGVVCSEFDEVIDVIENEKYDFVKLEQFIKESFDEHKELSSDLIINQVLLSNLRS